MFFIVSFIISKIQKQPKYPLTNECIKKVRYTYMVQYYSVMKKDETLSFAPTWIDPDGIMLNEISQMMKDKDCMISLTCRI